MPILVHGLQSLHKIAVRSCHSKFCDIWLSHAVQSAQLAKGRKLGLKCGSYDGDDTHDCRQDELVVDQVLDLRISTVMQAA